eukprot:gnl/Spiro4/12769_TR6768_c0_g1_i1.p1 gnl/Spiro4/12769_TR6768_c0_g1~~gnl/Spiro4/12769_TR6768_c0_g1_i1.p1  ORF type:complete len:677 (-),score=198.52 gnl/Spiro4/12769_TR6768_c0_g1_i1:149-2104(-)
MSADPTTVPAPAAVAAAAAPADVNGATPAAAPAAPVPAAPYTSASLYVGDLSPDVTEAILYEVFSRAGQVASIRVCRDAESRRSLCYAYVNYSHASSAERALDILNYFSIKSGSAPEGRPCRVMWSRRDPSIRKSGVGNVFIKNLNKEIDSQALYDTFSPFGTILSCHVATDRVTGVSKGFAFVHYETKQACESAIKAVNNMKIMDKVVYVGEFIPRAERDAMLGYTPDHGQFDPEHPPGAGKPYRNVYIKDLDPSVDEETLQRVFGAYGPITSKIIMRFKEGEKAGQSRGFGFVCFAEPAHAQAAVEALNGTVINDKKITCNRALKKEQRARQLSQLLHKPYENFSQGTNLYVKYLDESVTTDDLRKEFSNFGDVKNCKVEVDAKGKSKGFGYVSFATAEGAAKAIQEMNLHRTSSNSKPLYVGLFQPRSVRQQALAARYAHQQMVQYQQPQPYLYGNQYGVRVPGMQYGQLPPQQARQRWAATGGAGGVRQPQQQYGQFPAQHLNQGGAQMRGAGGRGGRQGGQQNRPMPPQGIPGKVMGAKPDIRYAAGARNSQPLDPTYMMDPANAPLDANKLANAPVVLQKRLLGERLYPMVQTLRPDLAGKITGMLLEMDNSELLNFLEAPDALRAKVDEAVEALRKHREEGGSY